MVSSVAFQARAAGDSVFTVQGVKVDVTAESAAKASEQAFFQARNLAFEQLAERLLSGDQFEYFKIPHPSVISSFVKDYEITQEQRSNVRYIGTFTFRFDDGDVRNYLGGQGFAYTDVSSKPVLVLPFYRWGAQTFLWRQNNPWRDAWSQAQLFSGLVPVIVPIGDVQDVSDIGDDEALSYAPEKLQNITARYAAGETIIMIAVPEWNDPNAVREGGEPDRLTVMVYRTDRGRPEQTNRYTIAKADLAADESVFDAAVQRSRKHMRDTWKSQTLVNAGQGNNLTVRVKFNTMKEWIETQKILRGVQGVNDMKLLSLKQNEANIELQFQGTEHRLRLALAQADMTLTAPRVNFAANNNGGGQGNMYGAPAQQRTSPLVYDLYLNKYR